MSMSVGAVSSAQAYSSLLQSRPADGSGDPDVADPLMALLQAVSTPANQARSSTSSPPSASGSKGARFSPESMGSLLSAQGQQPSGGAAGSSAGGTDDSSADAQGATTTTTTNPDGSITTATTYADGTLQTATTPAPSSPASGGTAQSNGAGGHSDADQLLKLLSNGIQALAPAAALLAII